MTPSEEEQHFDWRRGGAAAGGLIAALVLLAMVFLVALSNGARERALEAERRAYNVALVVRSVDSSMSRSEAALGRFVLDEEVRTSGNIYYSQWRLAGRQIGELQRLVRNSPDQRRRVAHPDADHVLLPVLGGLVKARFHGGGLLARNAYER